MGAQFLELFDRELVSVEIKQDTGFEGEGWRGVVPALRKGRYFVTGQAVAGEAPKDFIRVYEYGAGRRDDPSCWPAFIAKVGHKWYPAESVTEQLMTDIGGALGLRMARSQLMHSGGLIRFLSRYFLTDVQSLVHGAEIVAGYLEDDEFVKDVGHQRIEGEIFTFQVLQVAIGTRFTSSCEAILLDFVRMIGFDALVGNQDRHLYNWGVVVDVEGREAPQFSPIYDTARGLFWNTGESGIAYYDRPNKLQKYVDGAKPLIGWDGEGSVNHLRLVRNVAASDRRFRDVLREIGTPSTLERAESILDHDYRRLLSKQRRELIKRCLRLRFEKYADAVEGK